MSIFQCRKCGALVQRGELFSERVLGPTYDVLEISVCRSCGGPSQEKKDSMRNLAQIAYEAYIANTFRQTDTREMPRWSALATNVQDAWRAAVAAVESELRKTHKEKTA